MTYFLIEWERWADGDVRIKRVLLNDVEKDHKSADSIRSFQIKARLRELGYLIEQCMGDETGKSKKKKSNTVVGWER